MARIVLTEHVRSLRDSRTTAIVTAVTVASGLVTASAAVAIATGLADGRWTEIALVVGAAVFIAAAGAIVVAAGIAGLLRAVTFFLTPEEPPGLDRINTLMEQFQRERERAAAKHPLESPPEIVLELRAISSGHH